MSKKNLRDFLETSTFGRMALIPYRLWIAFANYKELLKNIFSWSIRSREYTNFTYDLTGLNKEYLAAFVAVVTGVEIETIRGYIAELEQDKNLRTHIEKLTSLSSERYVADPKAQYGRRLGWYAFVRAKKPKLIIETGVDKGLGSCVITAALMKNAAEGCPGYMYGTDINPKAGYLLQAPYNEYGRILYGDSIETLKQLVGPVNIFVNDSDHSAEYEMKEYQTIAAKLAEDALIIGDNAHCSEKLLKFAQQTHRNFLFFQENPKAHWYFGAGIGVAFPKS